MWQQVILLPNWLERVLIEMRERLLASIPGLLTGLLILLVFFFVARVVRNLIQSLVPRVHADVNVVLLLSRVCYYGILALGLFTALPKMGIDVTALITGLGLTGFALGFALKDVLSNLMAGIMLLVYRPFQIGDQITMGTYEGTIETIRMRDTVLRGYDGRLIIIPNTKLITEVVVNNRSARLVREAVEVELAPATNVETARSLLMQTLAQTPVLAGRVEPHVQTDADARAVRLQAHFWRDPQRINAVNIEKEIARSIRQRFAEAGFKVNAINLRHSVEQPAPAEAEDVGSASEIEPERAG